METWAPILGFERYEVSDLAQVRTKTTGRVRKQYINSRTGYHQITLRKKGSLKSYPVNIYRAVYEAFNGPVPKGMEIDHIDSDRKNSKLSNLRICSKSYNLQKADRGNPRGYRGVFNHKTTPHRFWARVMKDGVNHHLGTFDTPEEAARAYNKKALELFGEHAGINKGV